VTLTCALSILLTKFGLAVVFANSGSLCVHRFAILRVLSVLLGDESILAALNTNLRYYSVQCSPSF
jgi:hypothetical protein